MPDIDERPDDATVRIRRLERKLARVRSSRDKLRAELLATRKHGWALTHPGIAYWHGEYMKAKYPQPPPLPSGKKE
jgi:hypothetical protein